MHIDDTADTVDTATDDAVDTSTDTTADDTVDTSADTDTDTSADTDDTSDEGDDDSTVLGGGGDEDEDGDSEGDDDAGAPEAYAFELKDAEGNDIELDDELVAAADPVFRELNLTNEQAQKLASLAPSMLAKGQQSAIDQITAAGAAQKKDWLKAFKDDPDIGGENRKASETQAAKGLDAMGFDAKHPFRKLLDESGLGNHPDMIRTFKQLGDIAGEDGTFARSSSASEKQPAGWESRYKED